MRLLFLFVLSILSSASFSQDVDNETVQKKRNSISRHQLIISPASVWLNKGFFYGHALKYQFQLKSNMRISLETDGTLFRKLDDRTREEPKTKILPLLNQSAAVYSMDVFGKGKTINRNKEKRYISSIRFGYHFFEHATEYFNYDYWSYDSTAVGGFESIRSFQSHSVTAGLGFQSQKYKRKNGQMSQVSNHTLSLDYLGMVHFQLTAYSINDAENYNIRNISNPYELRKSGARFTYQYTRYLNPHVGIHFGIESVFVPYLKDYIFRSEYYAPRGAERILPLYTNAKLGVSFAF